MYRSTYSTRVKDVIQLFSLPEMTKGKLNVRVIDREGHLELALVPWFTKRCPSNFLAEGFALLNLGDVEKVPLTRP